MHVRVVRFGIGNLPPHILPFDEQIRTRGIDTKRLQQSQFAGQGQSKARQHGNHAKNRFVILLKGLSTVKVENRRQNFQKLLNCRNPLRKPAPKTLRACPQTTPSKDFAILPEALIVEHPNRKHLKKSDLRRRQKLSSRSRKIGAESNSSKHRTSINRAMRRRERQPPVFPR